MDYADVVTQQESIARRRKLMDALQQQAMGSPIVGNTGLGQALAKIATAYVTSKNNQALDAETTANKDAYGKQLTNESMAFMDKLNGKAGQTLSQGQASDLMNNDVDPGTLSEPVKANPREAIIQAMTSRLPEMQKLGTASMGSLQKQVPQVGDIMKNDAYTAASRLEFARTNDPSALKPAMKPHAVNGQLFGADDAGGSQRIVDARDQFSPVGQVATANGSPIMGQTVQGTGEVKFAPPGGQTINIGNDADKEVISHGAGVLKESRQAMIEAHTNLQSSDRLYKLASDPAIISGFAADPVLTLARLGSKLGFNGPDSVQKTQAMMTEMAAQTLQKGSLLRGTFSDKDVVFLKQVAAGDINLSPEVIKEVAALGFTAAHNAIQSASQQYNSAKQAPGVDRLAALYPLPHIGYSAPNETDFPTDDYGKMTYQTRMASPAGAPVSGKSGGVVNWRDYVNGGQ